MPQNRVGMRTRSSKKKPSMKQRGRNGRTEDARRRPDRQVLHWTPRDKVGMRKEAPGRSPSYSKGAGAKEPTSRNGGQTRQALHWTPQDKVGMRKRSSKKKPSIQQGQELEDSSNESKVHGTKSSNEEHDKVMPAKEGMKTGQVS